MSRAFTSEEYEAPDIVIDVQPEVKNEADYDLVFSYSRGRSVTDPELPHEIGLNFLNGSDGFFQDDGFAVKWLKKAVAMNNEKSMLALAEFYLRDTKTNGYREAALLLEKAKNLGSLRACGYLDMSTVEDPSTKKAFVTFRLNAELGSAEACMKLAKGFEKQYYGRDRCRAAAVWYIRAFRRGEKEAAKRALTLHYRGKTELTDDELNLLHGGEA